MKSKSFCLVYCFAFFFKNNSGVWLKFTKRYPSPDEVSFLRWTGTFLKKLMVFHIATSLLTLVAMYIVSWLSLRNWNLHFWIVSGETYHQLTTWQWFYSQLRTLLSIALSVPRFVWTLPVPVSAEARCSCRLFGHDSHLTEPHVICILLTFVILKYWGSVQTYFIYCECSEPLRNRFHYQPSGCSWLMLLARFVAS